MYAVDQTVGDGGYCVESAMEVSEDLQKGPDLGSDEWRNWSVDDPELESDDVAEAGIWKKRRMGEALSVSRTN